MSLAEQQRRIAEKVEKINEQINTYMEQMYNKLLDHVGHNIQCVSYGTKDNIWNVALECRDCGIVLIDFDHPDLEE